MMTAGLGTSARIQLQYEVRSVPDTWELPEVLVPESRFHELLVDHVRALLSGWIERTGRNAIVARNLALRWLEERPKVGVDPDLCLIEPPPPDHEHLVSLCTWKPDHPVPSLAVEVVSAGNPYKDYTFVQDKYAVSGVRELWVIDALLLGPRSLGGPVPLQLWRREGGDPFACVYRGGGPFRSPAVDAWVRVAGESVEIADDPSFVRRWPTQVQAHREWAELERARADDLERQLRELEAERRRK